MLDRAALIAQYLQDPLRDELAAALFVARVLDREVQAAAVDAQLTALYDALTAAHGPTPSVPDLIAFVHGQGFGAADDPHSLDSSRIDRVLASKRGIPISLAVIYVMLGRRFGFTTRGINFPGHFLAMADDVLIDPLRGVATSRDECLRWLAEANLQHLGDTAFAAAAPDDVAMRMLNNIKAIHLAQSDFIAALDIVDCQLPLVADEGPLQLERAEFWFRLGHAGAALAVLESARERLRDSPWHAEIDARIKRLVGRTRTTVH